MFGPIGKRLFVEGKEEFMLPSSSDIMVRFLLPCTKNVDREAITAAIKVTSLYGGILVPLSLRSAFKAETGPSDARRPAHHFLDSVQQQAAIMKVPVEWIEASTHDTGQSIHVFAEEMNCAGILLFVREGRGVLLETNEVQYVIEHERIILPFLVRLIAKKTIHPSAIWTLSWFQKKKNSGTTRRKTAFPRWYPFALLIVVLIVAALVGLNGIYLFKEPVFTLLSLLAKLFFVCVITYSLVVMLAFFVETWRQKQP
jgi:hypothetical protein